MDLKVVFFACLVHQFKNVPLEMSLAPHEFFHYRWNVIFCWPQVPCWYLCRYLHSHSIWIYRYHQQRDTSWEQNIFFSIQSFSRGIWSGSKFNSFLSTAAAIGLIGSQKKLFCQQWKSSCIDFCSFEDVKKVILCKLEDDAFM